MNANTPALPFPRVAKSGGKPKPTEIKIQEGNRGRRPLDPLEPKTVALTVLPPAPDHLGEVEAGLWEKFGAIVIEMKILTAANLAALEVLCEAEGKRMELEDDLRENGMFQTVTTTAGDLVERARPQLAECERISKRVVDMLREFGLTPASRPKVQMVPGGGKRGEGREEDGDGYFG